jgi:cyanate permease
MTGAFIGSAFGPLPLGILYSLQHGYDTALLLLMALPAIAFILALFSKKPCGRVQILP